MQYLFKHILMRDAVYDMQLRRRLSDLHRRAAEAIEELHASDLAPHYADLVYHYHYAGAPAQERHYARLAGETEAEAGSYEAAVHFLSRALDLTPVENVEGRYDLLLKREEVHHVQGAREAQATDLDALAQLVGLSREGGVQNVGWAAAVAWRQARYTDAISDYAAAIAAAQQAVQFAQAIAPVEAAQARRVWGSALECQGNYSAAQEQYRQGVASARSAETSVAASIALVINLRGLGVVAWDMGDYTAARNHYEQALAISQKIGDRGKMSSCLNNLGGVAYAQGDYATARSYYEQSLDIFQEIGDRWRASFCLNNLGVIAHNLGDYATARNYYEQVMAIGVEIGDQRGIGICFINLGEAAMAAGRYAAAQDHLRRGLMIAQEVGSRDIEGKTLNTLGFLSLLQDAPDRAAGYYQQALTIRTELNQPHYRVEDQTGLAQAALVEGNMDDAQVYAQRVVAYLQENPKLDGAENPMRAFRFSWQVLAALDHPQADDILAMAAQIIQEQVENIIDPAGRKMYLDQPHHRALWEAWQTREAAS